MTAQNDRGGVEMTRSRWGIKSRVGRNRGEARVESKLSSGEQGEGGRPSSMVFTLATAAFGWRLKTTVAVEGERSHFIVEGSCGERERKMLILLSVSRDR